MDVRNLEKSLLPPMTFFPRAKSSQSLPTNHFRTRPLPANHLPKISRRLAAAEALQLSAAAHLQDQRRRRSSHAFSYLRLRQLCYLLSAWGAERQCRTLSSHEAAAKQAYHNELLQVCRWPEYASISKPNSRDILSSENFNLEGLLIKILTGILTRNEVSLASKAAHALEEGRCPPPEEQAAHEKWRKYARFLASTIGVKTPEPVLQEDDQ